MPPGRTGQEGPRVVDSRTSDGQLVLAAGQVVAGHDGVAHVPVTLDEDFQRQLAAESKVPVVPLRVHPHPGGLGAAAQLGPAGMSGRRRATSSPGRDHRTPRGSGVLLCRVAPPASCLVGVGHHPITHAPTRDRRSAGHTAPNGGRGSRGLTGRPTRRTVACRVAEPGEVTYISPTLVAPRCSAWHSRRWCCGR